MWFYWGICENARKFSFWRGWASQNHWNSIGITAILGHGAARLPFSLKMLILVKCRHFIGFWRNLVKITRFMHFGEKCWKSHPPPPPGREQQWNQWNSNHFGVPFWPPGRPGGPKVLFPQKSGKVVPEPTFCLKTARNRRKRAFCEKGAPK